MRGIRKSTVMGMMVLPLRSPQVDGREELITRSGTPTWPEPPLGSYLFYPTTFQSYHILAI